MADLTPMMQQYVEMKKQYPDCILFYRLGDFYEMFYEDAFTASKELELALTGKACGLEERAPMCGIPYHAVDGYLDRLVEKGYRVAICEQVEDPKVAKGLVKREVIRIVTPGTNVTQLKDAGRNNYLMGIIAINSLFGVSTVDISTGDYYVTEVDTPEKVLDEVCKFAPSEIICSQAFLDGGTYINVLKNRHQAAIRCLEEWYYNRSNCENVLKKHFCVLSLAGLGLAGYSAGINAAGAVLQYLIETQKNALEHLTHLTPYATSKYMVMDTSTRRNLELVETLREKTKRGSLLWVLDKTKTAMGARLLRNDMEQPLVDPVEINTRLDAVEELVGSLILREEIREYLSAVYDLERLAGKISYRTANPKDLLSLAASLSILPAIRTLLAECSSKELKELFEKMDPLEELCALIQEAVDPEAPVATKDGGLIRTGYHSEVDSLRRAKTEGKDWLAALEAREKERTGIKNLRIKFNRVFGYYLEVTNSFKELVPPEWIRKQTLANAERYTTQELKELEDKILNAEDRLTALEYELFVQIRETAAEEVSRIQRTAKAVARLDVCASLAYAAESGRYVRPNVNKGDSIKICGGRHPVVEKVIAGGSFVANDTYLNNKENRLSIITGPNMAGKSTYMRQTALIVLMAQIGSFVPADLADIGIVDRIFTRVGASDDLASGQSTFMVEMTEVANILRNATRDSLLILDEIGRGTSTFDGLSIAWAVAEHISNPDNIGAKTLFATHYHELTELEGKLEGANNYCIAVKEEGEDIVFLRKIIKGGADKSYGIQVARLAGIPKPVLNRAKEIAAWLSQKDITKRAKLLADQQNAPESSLEIDKEDINIIAEQKNVVNITAKDAVKIAKEHAIIEEIRRLDLANITPIAAINKLYELQAEIKNLEAL